MILKISWYSNNNHDNHCNGMKQIDIAEATKSYSDSAYFARVKSISECYKLQWKGAFLNNVQEIIRFRLSAKKLFLTHTCLRSNPAWLCVWLPSLVCVQGLTFRLGLHTWLELCFYLILFRLWCKAIALFSALWCKAIVLFLHALQLDVY